MASIKHSEKTLPEMRQVALQAVRDFLRSHMLDPMKYSCEDAYKVLPSALKESPTSVAVKWYLSVGLAEMTYFYHEWEEWRKEVLRSS